MSADPRKRQKKLERRAAKRKSKAQQLVKSKPAGLGERLAVAAGYPVLHAGATIDLWNQGLGWVYLSRKMPGEMVAFSVFLVDRLCLGVKNAMAEIQPWFAYEHDFLGKMRKQFTAETMAPAAVRKLVEGAVEYARQLGLAPHPDYHKAKRIFGDIDAGSCREEFEFGQDGKPYFIAGPNDTPARCTQIMKTLTFHCGPDGFDYTIPVSPNDMLADELTESSALTEEPDHANR